MELLEKYFEIALETPDGIKKLRKLILILAIQGKLVPQDPKDQPASELLEEIEEKKECLIRDGKIRKQELLPPVKANEKTYAIPKGWNWVRFNEITINRDGERVPISKDSRTHIQGKYDYYGASGVIDKVNDFLFDKSLLLIGEDGANLISRSTPIAFIAHGKYWVNNHAHVIDSLNFELLQFLEKFINAIDLEPYVTGTAQPKMNQAKMNSIPISLPPLAEQKRIVAKIDQLMALCDKLESERNNRNQKRLKVHSAAMGNLLSAPEKETFNKSWSFITKNFSELYSVQENVAELKKAILQLAVMGKLVPQDPKDQPARELLKEIEGEKKRLIKEGKIKKQEVLSAITIAEVPYAIPKGWAWVRLADLGQLVGGGTPSKQNPAFWNGNIPWISPKDMKVLRICDSIDHITEEAIEASSAKSIPNPALLCVVRGMILAHSFPTAILDTIATINQDMKALLPYNPSIIVFIQLAMRGFTNKILALVERSSHGTCRLDTSKLEMFLLPLPPLAEQKRIVTKVEQLIELCISLEEQMVGSTEKQTTILDAVLAGR
jgi:type I restriction enzyme S subunit